MDYQIGEYLVHPAFGVGSIKAIEKMIVEAAEPTLYYRVAFDDITIWIPVQYRQQSIDRLHPSVRPHAPVRPLTPKSELPRYRTVLSSPPVPLADDFRVRQEGIESRLKQGSFQALCELMRDLNARRVGNQLNKYDSTLLEKLRLSIQKEWAVSSGISEEQAAFEIEQMLSSR